MSLDNLMAAMSGVARYWLFGKFDERGFHAWRDLHCRTNGLATDALNNAIAMTSSAPQFDEVIGVAGHLDANRRREVLDIVKRDGIYVFPGKIEPNIVAELQRFAFSTPSCAFPVMPGKATEAIFDPAAPISPACWHKPQTLIANETVQRLVADPTMYALAAEYLKTTPRLMSISLWHSSHRFPEASSEAAQMFHFDLDFPRWIKFFIYLSDVTAQSGPHCFVKGSHKGDKAGAKLRRRGPIRIPDEDIYSAYGEDSVATVCGEAGTLIILDTRAFHKGVKPTHADRLMFELQFTNSGYSLPYETFSMDAKVPALQSLAKTSPQTFLRFRFH
jgi:hypothetical protein